MFFFFRRFLVFSVGVFGPLPCRNAQMHSSSSCTAAAKNRKGREEAEMEMAMGQKDATPGDHRFWSIFPFTKGFQGTRYFWPTAIYKQLSNQKMDIELFSNQSISNFQAVVILFSKDFPSKTIPTTCKPTWFRDRYHDFPSNSITGTIFQQQITTLLLFADNVAFQKPSLPIQPNPWTTRCCWRLDGKPTRRLFSEDLRLSRWLWQPLWALPLRGLLSAGRDAWGKWRVVWWASLNVSDLGSGLEAQGEGGILFFFCFRRLGEKRPWRRDLQFLGAERRILWKPTKWVFFCFPVLLDPNTESNSNNNRPLFYTDMFLQKGHDVYHWLFFWSKKNPNTLDLERKT